VKLHRYRERKKNGISVYRLALPDIEIELLSQRENLLPMSEPTHEHIQQALQTFVFEAHRAFH
jgi:hypothetical protein